MGGIGNRFDSRLQINGQVQEGTDLKLERNGLRNSQWSLQAGLTWRFLSRNRIDVGYFSASRSGSLTYDTSITIGDNVYPNGATVSATVKDGFLIADYRYSFVKTDDLELAGVVGVHGDRFKYDVSATGKSGGVDAEQQHERVDHGAAAVDRCLVRLGHKFAMEDPGNVKA